jgi:hypothetical protein
MTEQMMTRLAMVLQNKAPSTLEKYIQKLAENVLVDYENGLSLLELEKEILDKFNLSFSTKEIQNALKQNSNKSIHFNKEKYFITEKTRSDLLKLEPITNTLKKQVTNFLKQHEDFNYPATQIENSLLSYLYFCFNSNVNNLLSLLNKEDKQLSYSDEFSDEDVEIINEFIEWDNDEKNEFIYKVVAICYEYCMLTVKNDNILSKQLFAGKKFYLDSNIIFRLAGINKDERSHITTNFVERCKKVGIKLCCTTATYEEIYRVIRSQISYIKGMTKDSPPIAPKKLSEIEINYVVNDFYALYYEWTQKDENHYLDYKSFYEMLLELIRNALEKVEVVSISKNINNNGVQFQELSYDLREYKNNRILWKTVSRASSDTDVTNILEIINKREKNQDSIWQTNDFIVSADQNLIAWTIEKYSGVPIVVLPSVWLSIILRFTGRSSDDYNSFCLFLTQREHRSFEKTINPTLLVGTINSRTNNVEVRERIIKEVTEHKADYSFDDESDYESTIDKAFDKVINEMAAETKLKISEVKDEMDRRFGELSDSSNQRMEEQKKELEEQHKMDLIINQEKTVLLLAKEKAQKKTKRFNWLSENDWFCYLIGCILLLIGTVSIIFRFEPMWTFAKQFFSSHSELGITIIFEIFIIFISAFFTGILKLIQYLGSEKRKERLIQKYEKELKKQLETSKTNI